MNMAKHGGRWLICAVLLAVAGCARQMTQHIYAVSPAGVLQWTLNMTFDKGVPSFAADGTLYLLQGSTLYALNSDGALKWSWRAPGPVPYGPLVIGRDNMLYVGDEYGRLLALGPK